MRWKATAGVLAVIFVIARGAHGQRRVASRTEPPPDRDPCDEVLHAADYEDGAGAGRAYRACRERFVAARATADEDQVRTMEDVAEALHGLRTADGTFCVEPAAPFDLSSWTSDAQDTRACFEALDRFLTSEDVIRRFLRDDP